MEDAIRVLSEDALIRLGGWHPRYARVLLIEHDADYAIALIDGNGDRAELELEHWCHYSDGFWRGGSTSGHGQLHGLPSEGSWDSGEFVASIGRVEPGAGVRLEYGGRVYRRQASDIGV